MQIISFLEIVNLLILTAAIGYIFSGYIKDPSTQYRLIRDVRKFNWQDFKYATLVAAPGVVLHELGHKTVAILFGLSATFKVWFPGLGIAVFLKLINSPFLIIAPGYVEIPGMFTVMQSILISFAGPAVNLILWLGSAYILNTAKKLTRTQAITLFLTKRINMLLFIFNMLPIPPLDGSKVFYGIFKLIFSSFSF